MTVKDSYSTPSSGRFKLQILAETLSPYDLIIGFYISHKLVRDSIQYFASIQALWKTSVYFYSYLYLSLSLKVVTYPIILGNIKTNCVITSYNYPNKYLKFLFVFTILMQLQVILRKLYNQHQHHKFILASLHHKIVLLLLLPYQISTLLHYRKILFIFLAK